MINVFSNTVNNQKINSIVLAYDIYMIDRQKDRQIERYMHRQKDRKIDAQIERQKDKQKDRQIEIDLLQNVLLQQHMTEIDIQIDSKYKQIDRKIINSIMIANDTFPG